MNSLHKYYGTPEYWFMTAAIIGGLSLLTIVTLIVIRLIRGFRARTSARLGSKTDESERVEDS